MTGSTGLPLERMMPFDLEAERAKSIVRHKELLRRAARLALNESLPPAQRKRARARKLVNEIRRDLLRLLGLPETATFEEVERLAPGG